MPQLCFRSSLSRIDSDTAARMVMKQSLQWNLLFRAWTPALALRVVRLTSNPKSTSLRLGSVMYPA